MEGLNGLVNSFEHTRISDSHHTTFIHFPALPTELRLKIWNLCVTPRMINYNHSSAKRSKLKLDLLIPPLLHTNRESRSEVIGNYRLSILTPQKLYTHPDLDTLLWIRTNGPRTFRRDVERLSNDASLELHFKILAISPKFWNRVTTDMQYEEAYRRIRTAAGWDKLQIVDDSFGSIKWSQMKGKRVEIVKERAPSYYDFRRERFRKMGKDKLWELWDGGFVYEGARNQEVKYMSVAFKDV